MFAVIRSGAKQIKAVPGEKIVVDRQSAKVGDEVVISDVLLVSSNDGSEVKIGAPTVSGAAVKAKVIAHLRGPKIEVFKKRRRQGYTKKQGHRQDLSELLVQEIAS
ncbi:MAG: 50S ribosomal protein L21 [Deltaproteobacteria bacterium]|nr:50S ribosomal protein L21 [Deltaproteobacteria bacterium]